jgi:transcriptional regulator with XRE-family HTH domain
MRKTKVQKGALRQARELAKFSLTEAAELLNMTKQQLAQIETKDDNDPKITTIWEIADLYGVSIDELVGRKMK